MQLKFKAGPKRHDESNLISQISLDYKPHEGHFKK